MSQRLGVLSPYMPIRPTLSPEGISLNYRTYPSKDKLLFNITEPDYVIIQLELYRWAMNQDPKEMPEMIAAADFHDNLLGHTDISKRKLGKALLEILSYDPRRLKGATVELGNKAAMCYSIKHPLEVAYGLEWMICMWFRRYFNPIRTAEHEREALRKEPDYDSLSPIITVKVMHDELDFLATCAPEEFMDVLGHVDEIGKLPRIKWDAVWDNCGWRPSDSVIRRRDVKVRLDRPMKGVGDV